MSGGGSVVSIDSSVLSAAGVRSDKFEIVHRVDDPDFVDRVLEVCERHCVPYVLPTIDPELAVYAREVSALPIDELDDEYINQQAVGGYEVTVDFAVDRHGRLLGLSARRSIEMRGGEDSKAVTIEHPHLRTEVERLIAALPGAFGVLIVEDFVDDEAGRLHFTELNPRFGGGYPLSWQAGARFPLALMNGRDEASRMDGGPGIVMLRYDHAVFEDASFFGEALP